MTVVDLGAGTNPDPRADETVDLYADAIHRFDLSKAWELPDDHASGLVASHVVEHLPDPEHFFAEAGRVLRPGGWLEVTVPLGRDAHADPDHRQVWTYWTPAMFCREHRERSGRHWDPETAFRLVDRQLDVWLLGPWAQLTPAFQLAARRWPNWAAHRCGAGEVMARYRRVTDP